MFETLGFEEASPQFVSIWFGVALGALFGFLAQRTEFCIRRGLVGEDRREAAGVWLMALATAILGTQAAVALEWITFDDHRFMTADMPIFAISVGGAMFGGGMVLSRGCISRLTVLSAGGNLRAALLLLIFAVIAHATLKGMLAPLRTALAGFTVEFSQLSYQPVTLAVAALALLVALRSGNRLSSLFMAALIGLLVPAGWVGTGYVLLDEFDPIVMESLSFTSPATESLFWVIAGTSIPAGFGTGLFGGVLLGAFFASIVFRQFKWVSFESPAQTGRYALGAILMGIGGVLAGGCTVGAGLSGVPTGSFAAMLALLSMVGGALVMNLSLKRSA